MAQLIEIDNFWSGVAFYCPAGGAEVYAPEGHATESPCEHLLFSWIDAVGDYENACLEIATLLDHLSTNDGFGPCPFDESFLDALNVAGLTIVISSSTARPIAVPNLSSRLPLRPADPPY